MDEFDAIFRDKKAADTGVSLKRKAPVEGEREWLRVYETLPAQLLNAYGAASFTTMDPEEVWKEMNKPLKTGSI